MEQSKVEVHCQIENKIVGHLTLMQTGHYKIDRVVLITTFEPVEGKYVLDPTNQINGQFARCSHCGGILQLKAQEVRYSEKTDPSKPPGPVPKRINREEARAIAVTIASQMTGGVTKHIDSHADDMNAIILDRTTIDVDGGK